MGINIQKLIRQKNAAKLNLAEEEARAQQPAGGTVSGSRTMPNTLDAQNAQNQASINLQKLRGDQQLGLQDVQDRASINLQRLKNRGAMGVQEFENKVAINLQKLRGTQGMDLQGLKNKGAVDVQQLENEGDLLYMSGPAQQTSSTAEPTTMSNNPGFAPESLAQSLMPQTRVSLNLRDPSSFLPKPGRIDIAKINPKLGEILNRGSGLSTAGQAPTPEELEQDLMRRLGI